MISSSTTIHGTILHSAVASGAADVFEAVLYAVKETLTSEQVWGTDTITHHRRTTTAPKLKSHACYLEYQYLWERKRIPT